MKTLPLIRLLTFLLACVLPASVSAHAGYDERMIELTEDLAKKPGDDLLMFQMAETQCQHGDLTATLSWLDKVEAVAPGKYPTGLVRGTALVGAAQPAAAKKVLDAFITAHPENLRAIVVRAHAEQDLGQKEACLADFHQALQRSPAPEPDLILDTANAHLAYGQSLEAEQVFAQGIEKLGPVPGLVLGALEVELAGKNYDAALTRIAAMQANAPRQEPWMARRAEVLAQAGRKEEARATWQAIIDRIAALPNLERGSASMSKLSEQAHLALSTPTLTSQ